MKKKSPIIEGNGLQSRDFSYVKDTVKNIISLCPIAETGEIYNLSSDYEIIIKDLIFNIAKKMSWNGKFIYKNKRTSDVLKHIGCSKKIKKLIDFETTKFETAIQNTISYFKKELSLQELK